MMSGHLHMNIPLSPTNSKAQKQQQKLRVVSPISRIQNDTDYHELYAKGGLDSQYQNNIALGNINKKMYNNESPEILADFTQLYNNTQNYQQNINGNNTPNNINQQILAKQQQYLHQLQLLQQQQQQNQLFATTTTNSHYQTQENDSKKVIMKGKRIDEQQQNVHVNPKFHDTYLYEHENITIDEEGIYKALNHQYNSQTVFHEKAKSLSSTQQIKQQQNDNIMQQQYQQQLSPNKVMTFVQINKLVKNSSKDLVIDPSTISPSQNNQLPIKTRRKKSQGKININFQNIIPEEVQKNQQNNINVRSSSQPQVRSQSQQANSQERVLQLKKNSIRNVDQNQIMINKDALRMAQIESSVERIPSGSNLNKQGSLKIMLKKNSSIKQLPTQQAAVKITKDQILLKNQQNFNSQGSIGNNQQVQSSIRARSVSNSKFTKKKASPQQQQDTNQQFLEENLQTCRINSKDKNIIGNSFNQGINIQNKQRCKSTNKAQGSVLQEEQQIIQNSQGGFPNQNQSKVLMFKTNNEESNAKVAALRSIIKLSSNANTNNYMQNKQVPPRNQSKENVQNQSQNHIQPAVQMKQIVQKMKVQETSQGQFVQKCASANPNKPVQQQNQYMQRITSG